MFQHMESPSHSAEPRGSQHPGLPEEKNRFSIEALNCTHHLFLQVLVRVLLTSSYITLLSTDLLRGVRVDKLVVDVAGLDPLHV